MKNFTRFHEHLNTRCNVSKKQLLSLITLCIATIGYSQTFTALDNNNNTLEFTITSATTVEVKDYISGSTDVDIPATVTNNGTTYTVTGIGLLAFLNNGLTSAVIPASVTNIGLGAFQNNALSSIVIPDGVTSIPNSAFYINQLTNVTIPNSVTSIGNYAFKDNVLTSVVFGNSVSSIGEFTFHNNQLTSITLPNSMTSIGNLAFQGNPLNCIISEGTTAPTINSSNGGLDTFSITQRSNIDLSIPSGTANAYTSSGWIGFNSVAEGLTGNFTIDYITYEVISSTNSTVRILDYNSTGGSVVNIPATVVRGCVTYSVTEVGSTAFLQKGLTSVEIPNSVTSIGSAAFFDNMNLINVMLQDGLISIGDNSFNSCGLTNVTIPSTVTNIGIFAFYSNPLTDVTSLAITPALISTGSNDSFSADRSNIHLHIPAGTLGAYVTDPGALWTGFNPVTEDALSIDDFELTNDVKVITAQNTIKVLHANSVQLKAYSISTISGQKIANGTESEISTSTFTSGIYILKLDFDKGTVVKRLVLN